LRAIHKIVFVALFHETHLSLEGPLISVFSHEKVPLLASGASKQEK
jgi:hypothetical protein